MGKKMYDDDPVKVYLHEIGKVAPKTREQEAECVRRIRAKDETSDVTMKDLMEANLALVVTVAQRHSNGRVHILDLIETGNNALMTALKAFADSNSHDFSAYVEPLIEKAVLHRITTQDC